VKRPAVVIAPLMLLGALPLIAEIAPSVLQSHSLRSVEIPWTQVFLWLIAAGIGAGILARYAAKYAFGAAAVLAAIGFLWLQFAVFPDFNTFATARPLWLAEHPRCAPPVSRDMLYGLEYYSGGPLLVCPVQHFPIQK
jgi:hypothetical protein